MSFSADITKFSKKIGATLDETSRAIKIKLFNGVIRDTRVDTGRLKGNWQTTTGAPNISTVERFESPGTKANGSEPANDEVIATVKGDTVDYMTNNLPYAEVWEEQDGMVAKNMARIDRIIKESIKQGFYNEFNHINHY